MNLDAGLSGPPARILSDKAEQAWETAWTKFFLPKTGLFYDYLGSYVPGRELAHLPTAEEVRRGFPDPCGYGTGMEDCMISAGVVLDLLVARFSATGDAALAERAALVVEGIHRCATVHGSPGFLARGICPEDGASVYPNSSRDQVTHAVHGLWRYARSPLADRAGRDRACAIVRAIADRMLRNCTPENDYDFLCVDGSRCSRGICRMWNVRGHEAARLPMIYAAAWDLARATGGVDACVYRDAWRRLMPEAVAQTLALDEETIRHFVPTYAMEQMQVSLELLHALEPDTALRRDTLRAMEETALRARVKFEKAARDAEALDLAALPARDWREPGGGISDPAGYRRVWYAIREVGEAASIALMTPGFIPDPDFRERLEAVLVRIDYDRVSSCGILHLLAAWWRCAT